MNRLIEIEIPELQCPSCVTPQSISCTDGVWCCKNGHFFPSQDGIQDLRPVDMREERPIDDPDLKSTEPQIVQVFPSVGLVGEDKGDLVDGMLWVRLPELQGGRFEHLLVTDGLLALD